MFLNGWLLASRIRFALVQTAISAGIVLGVAALVNGLHTLWESFWFIIVVVLIAFLLNGWVWYPRALKRFTSQTG
jgi:hypothetical protein